MPMTSEDVRRIRTSMKLSRSEFARLVEVSEQTVWRWENEERPVSNPYPRIILAIEQGIDLPTLSQTA